MSKEHRNYTPPPPEPTRTERFLEWVDDHLFNTRPRRLVIDALGAVATVGGGALGVKFIEWSQVAVDDETRMISGFTGVGTLAFAAAGAYVCVKAMREEFTEPRQQG